MAVDVKLGDPEIAILAHKHFAEGLYRRVVEGAMEALIDESPNDDDELDRGIEIHDHTEYEGMIVGTAEHTQFVVEGTGERGPRHQRIEMPEGEVMVWFSEEEGRLIFARSSRGMAPDNFPERAVEREERMLHHYAERQAADTRRKFGS